jgi:hypothetical protein
MTTGSAFFEAQPTSALSTENPNAKTVIAERCMNRSPAQKFHAALEDIGPSVHRLTEKKPRSGSGLRVCHLRMRAQAAKVEYAAPPHVPFRDAKLSGV